MRTFETVSESRTVRAEHLALTSEQLIRKDCTRGETSLTVGGIAILANDACPEPVEGFPLASVRIRLMITWAERLAYKSTEPLDNQ